MSKLARLTGEIQAVLSTGTISATPEIENLAREYAEECRKVADRLDRCDEFLSRGLIAETVMLAKTAPDLLDELTLLEFPKKDNWEQMMELHQLTLPPEIPNIKAVSLNRAYSEHHILCDLLGRWRLLNIGVAPATRRLSVLRQLLRLAPNNLAFQDNLGEMEEQRLEGMLGEARTASLGGDHLLLRDLIIELDNPENWINDPNENIASEIRELCQASIGQVGRKEAQVILRQILDGFNHKNESRVQKLFSEFESKCAESNIHSGDDMFRVLHKVRIWLNEVQNRRERLFQSEQAQEQIRRAIKDKSSTESELLKLQDNYHRNEGTTCPMNPNLAQELDIRIERFQRKEKTREMLIMGGAFIIGALVIVIFLVIIIKKSR